MAFNSDSLIAFLIAVSFAAGLNLYATVAVLGLLARFHVAALPHGLEMMGSTWVIVAAVILFALEFVADKVPVLDVVWSALHTFIRIPVAALITFEASQQLSPEMRLMVTLAAAGAASIAHGTKTAVRVAVTPSPEPVSNIALSAGEDVLAAAIAGIATQHPLIVGGVVIAVLVLCLLTARWILRRIRIAIAKFMQGFRRETETLS